MKKNIITDDFFYVKTRDHIGGTIRTDVFKKYGFYEAFSSYWQDKDEEIMGYAKSYNDEQAVKESRKDLRKEWKEYQEKKAAGIIQEAENVVDSRFIKQ